MNFDFLHTIVTTFLLLAAIFGLESSGVLEGKQRWHRALAIGLVVFMLVAAINVVWPYGSS